ncbi:MAG: 4-hydroxy-tetrahydrodipicolinate reductase [Bacteroidia bacterium]|nr:4-hydroxy-tetrahydrodipicolinate reductase [Bacteroidia bacterium]
MKIILIGYGRMGRAIEQQALKAGHLISRVISSPNSHLLTSGLLKEADLAIEFTQPEAAFENLRTCIHAGIPVVSGTTGWQNQLDQLKSYCLENDGSVLWSSNFSIGVNIFFEITRQLASLLKNRFYTVSINETHHLQKKDKPSGTAITLAQKFINVGIYDHWTSNPEEKGLLITSQREGEVTGIHSVNCNSEFDRISLTHEAFSRTAFAMGAVVAAEWLKGKKGFFSMQDVLTEVR